MPDLNAQLREQIDRAAARPVPALPAPPAPPMNRTAADASAEDVQRRAAQAQARSVAQSVFFFGSAAAASAALRSQAPRTAGALLTFSTGFEFVQTAAEVRAAGGAASRAIRPTAFAALLFGPQPVGVVPPEVFGLRPDYLDVRLIPEALQFETINTAADANRLAAFLASNARAAFESELVALGRLPLDQLRQQIAAIEALPVEARLVGSPLQTYYSVAVETLARRERLTISARADAVPRTAPPALFVSSSQAARIASGELLPIPAAPLVRPQVPGALPVPLLDAGALPAGDGTATGSPSLLPDAPDSLAVTLPALFPSLVRPTNTSSRATDPTLREGQREHVTERADP